MGWKWEWEELALRREDNVEAATLATLSVAKVSTAVVIAARTLEESGTTRCDKTYASGEV